jgi:hypothetical protein
MKKILIMLIGLWSVAHAQSKGYLRYDTLELVRPGGNAELNILNGTRSVTGGVLTNMGNGRTRFVLPSGGALSNLGSAFRIGVDGTNNIKTIDISNGLTGDSATTGQIGVKLGGRLTANTRISANNNALLFDSLGTGTRWVSYPSSGGRGIKIVSTNATDSAYMNIEGSTLTGTRSVRLATNKTSGGYDSYIVSQALTGATQNIIRSASPTTSASISTTNLAVNIGVNSATSSSAGTYYPDSITHWISGGSFFQLAKDTVRLATDTLRLVTDNMRFVHPSLSSAAAGFVWSLVDEATGEGEWGPPVTGTGGPNSNVGAGYRWAIPGGNSIKTAFGSNTIILDSAANANGITINVDTSYVETIWNFLNRTMPRSGRVNQNGHSVTFDSASLFRIRDTAETTTGGQYGSIHDFTAAGYELLTYDSLIAVTTKQNTLNGFEVSVRDFNNSDTSNALRVTVNGIEADGITYSNSLSLRMLVYDTVSKQFRSRPIPTATTPGLQDVITEDNALTGSNSVTLTGGSLLLNGASVFLNLDDAGGDVGIVTSDDLSFTANDVIWATDPGAIYDTTNTKILVRHQSTGRMYETHWPVSSGSSGLTVGTTTIASNSSRAILYDSSGILKQHTSFLFNSGGELQVGSGTDKGAWIGQFTGNVNIQQATDGQWLLQLTSANGGRYMRFYIDNAGNGIMDSEDQIIFRTNSGGSNVGTMDGNQRFTLNQGMTINEDGTTTNTRIESDTEANMFLVDATNNRIGIFGVTSPTARLHLGAGTATASTAPFKFSSGTLNTTAEAGAKEYNGHFYSTHANAIRVADAGTLTSNTTTVGNVGTGEDNLMSYTIPAGTLSADGDRIEFTMSFSVAANSTLKVYFGGTQLFNFSALATDAVYRVTGEVYRTGAATQRATFHLTGGLSVSQVGYQLPTETLSGTVVLRATGEGSSNNDITQTTMGVKYFPAN